MAPLTDADLRGQFVASLEGDAATYRAFLTGVSGHLRAYFRRRLSYAPQDVEDLVQETLLAIHLHRHTYDTDKPLLPWVHGVARYKLLDHFRRRGAAAPSRPTGETDEAAWGSTDNAADEARLDIARLLAALPQRQRFVLEQVKVAGVPAADVASRLGVTESAIKVSIHRSLKWLARWIREPT